MSTPDTGRPGGPAHKPAPPSSDKHAGTPASPTYSLRNRLLFAILGASALLWLTSLFIMVGVAWYQSRKTFDHTLREAGYLIIAATTDLHRRGVIPPLTTSTRKDLPDVSDPETGKHPHDEQHRVHYQIVINNAVQLRTEGSPATPFVPQTYKGFANVTAEGEDWRIFAAHNRDGTFSVQVGQTQSSRQIVLYSLAQKLALPALALLALLGSISWFVIRKLLRPLETTAATLAQKSPSDLTPLSLGQQPRELEPITNALNRVLTRLDNALQAERHFTADAAHELRTPLSALRNQAQLLQRQHPPLREALQKLIHDIDRCTALVDHLLILARLDILTPGESETLQATLLDLPAFLHKLASNYDKNIKHTGIGLTLVCHAERLYANPQFIQIALRNLLDNAFRYCPPGSQIRLEAAPHGKNIQISVQDNGPGVPETELKCLTRRFFRILGSSKTGSGLGLSIVARIAELHHATLDIRPGPQGTGLQVLLEFPPAPALQPTTAVTQ